MNAHTDERSLSPQTDPLTGPLPLAPALADGAAAPTISDRLYQFAALAVGAFLLATML
jgi:hypothetical protein